MSVPFDHAWAVLKADLARRVPTIGGSILNEVRGSQTAFPAFSPETLAQGAVVAQPPQDDSGTPVMHTIHEPVERTAIDRFGFPEKYMGYEAKDEYRGLGQSMADYQRQASREGNAPPRSFMEKIRQAPARNRLNNQQNWYNQLIANTQGGVVYPDDAEYLQGIGDQRSELDWAQANRANQQALAQQVMGPGFDSSYDAQMAAYPNY